MSTYKVDCGVHIDAKKNKHVLMKVRLEDGDVEFACVMNATAARSVAAGLSNAADQADRKIIALTDQTDSTKVDA